MYITQIIITVMTSYDRNYRYHDVILITKGPLIITPLYNRLRQVCYKSGTEDKQPRKPAIIAIFTGLCGKQFILLSPYFPQTTIFSSSNDRRKMDRSISMTPLPFNSGQGRERMLIIRLL